VPDLIDLLPDLKVGLAEFSLDVLMQYEFLGFCRLGLNRMKFYETKT